MCPTISIQKIFLLFFIFISLFATAQPSLGDGTAFEAYFDGVIETHLRDKNIAGATLSVVHDGQLKLLKGYGYADVAIKKSVDPERTLFRIGSITKLFVWTAIMQLRAEGKINLDDDITQYFDGFTVPDNYDQPITIKHLMTHTPGFEDEILGLFANNTKALKPYGEILRNEMPSRVRPPGTHASYSNHGTGMAAYIIEKVSGLSFDEYVEQNILEPLKMDYATIRQPLPTELEDLISNGYSYAGGEFVNEDFEYVPLAPVGAASASAASMANLMLMYLNNGTYNGATILDSSTYQLMASPAHYNHPLANPMRHGFMDVSQNGVEIIGHGGDTFWFHSMLALMPKYNLGFFVSFNSEAGGGTTIDILEDFMDRFFPESLSSVVTSENSDLKQFEGEYAVNRYSYDDIFKLGKLVGTIELSATDDGMLKNVAGGNVSYWQRQDELVFRNKDNSNLLLFEKDQNGNISTAFYGLLPIMAFDKLEGLDKVSTHTNLFLFSFTILLVSFLFWSASYLFRKYYNIHRDQRPQVLNHTKRISWFSISIIVLFYIGFAIVFKDPTSLVFGMPGEAYFVFFLPFIILISTAILSYFIFKIWFTSNTISYWRKIGFGIIWLSLIITLWQWNYWNILGFNF